MPRFSGQFNIDDAKGGDLDLLLDPPNEVEAPAVMAARLSARVPRLLDGRSADVIVAAPNLRKQPPIHDIALEKGLPL